MTAQSFQQNAPGKSFLKNCKEILHNGNFQNVHNIIFDFCKKWPSLQVTFVQDPGAKNFLEIQGTSDFSTKTQNMHNETFQIVDHMIVDFCEIWQN